MSFKWLLFVTAAFSVSGTEGAKILIYPVDCGFNSRLMNLVKIADILNADGHNATVLVNNKVSKRLRPQGTKLLVYNVPNVEQLPLLTDPEILEELKNFSPLGDFFERWTDLWMPFCDSVLGTNLLHDLEAEGYDLVIIDNIWDCGRFLVEHLKVPSMTYSNWGFVLDSFSFYPILTSFICTAGTKVCNSDKMSFEQRTGNFLQSIAIQYYVLPKLAAIYERRIITKHNLKIDMKDIGALRVTRSPTIVNGDFVLDYPRPLMPHVIMIPGLFNTPPKALPEDFQNFIEGSAPHGVVVVSFGSMVSQIDEDKAEIFAKVLGELPHRVIWRYTGEEPPSLKDNTKLVSWFPQGDVLAHPLVKMFVTHSGISGTYEAAMNALPVIAIPLFADQEYNSKKLVGRGGMGVDLDLDTMTEAMFRDAVNEVLSNETYLKNAEKVSALLQDEEMPAKEKLLYWVNYTIRHNGARHLFSETALGMGNFVFYSIDVVLFLLAVSSIILIVVAALCYCCMKSIYHRLLTKRKQKTT